MGFFDRLFGGRAKTAEETRFPGEKMVVKAPMDGIVLPLEQLPDETFAAAILGPGCGIEPTGSTVYAPFDGKVTSIVSTLHAVGLESTEGIELLIHIGIDTIALRGSGFTPLVREGQAVKAGTPLLNVDLDAIRAAGLSTESAVIVLLSIWSFTLYFSSSKRRSAIVIVMFFDRLPARIRSAYMAQRQQSTTLSIFFRATWLIWSRPFSPISRQFRSMTTPFSLSVSTSKPI